MEKNNNNLKFSIRRLIYNDKYLIIVSLLLAVVIWIATSLNVGTAESKTIKMNVPIKLGDEISEQLGMQYYSLQDSIDINVTITGAKYVIGQVTPEDLGVKFDTSSVNRTGAQTIPILVSNSSKRLDFEISGTYPSSIEGFFDVNASKVMDLSLDYDKDAVADGYIFGTPVMSEDKIVVSGPQTYIERLESARVNVHFDNEEKLTTMYKEKCNIEFTGSDIQSSYFSVTSRTDTSTPLKNVSITIPVLKKANLPVSIDFTGKPSGMNPNSMWIRYSKTNVDAGILDSTDIDKATIGTIDFSKLTVGKQTVTFDITKLNGITILDNTKEITATITISNSYDEKSVQIDKSKIAIEGVPDGYKAIVKSIEKNNIIVVAPKNTPILSTDLTMKCDVSEQKDSKQYPIAITVNNNASWVYGEYSATIQLVENK